MELQSCKEKTEGSGRRHRGLHLVREPTEKLSEELNEEPPQKRPSRREEPPQKRPAPVMHCDPAGVCAWHRDGIKGARAARALEQ